MKIKVVTNNINQFQEKFILIKNINITGPKDFIDNNIFDKIKYPCYLFHLQKNIEEEQ